MLRSVVSILTVRFVIKGDQREKTTRKVLCNFTSRQLCSDTFILFIYSFIWYCYNAAFISLKNKKINKNKKENKKKTTFLAFKRL